MNMKTLTVFLLVMVASSYFYFQNTLLSVYRQTELIYTRCSVSMGHSFQDQSQCQDLQIFRSLVQNGIIFEKKLHITSCIL